MDIIFTLTERIKVLMREHKVKAAPLARAAQLNESAVRDILRGRSKNPGIVTLHKIASVLNLRPSALYESGQNWPVLGEVTADGVVKEIMESKDGVENPFFYYRNESYGAFLERSGSITPFAFEGDYLIFDRNQAELRDQDLGRPCVCWLDDGRAVIRAPRLADQPGLHHLQPVSLYGSPELNKRVIRASRIVLTLPSQFAPDLPQPTHRRSDVVHEEKAVYRAEKHKSTRA